jgi:hypothetical protein
MHHTGSMKCYTQLGFSVSLWNLSSTWLWIFGQITTATQPGGVREQDADENVRTYERGCNRLMKRSAKTFISCTTEYVPLGLSKLGGCGRKTTQHSLRTISLTNMRRRNHVIY